MSSLAAESSATTAVPAPVPLTVVLLGGTGQGKSESGNTLLEKEAFKASRCQRSVTTEVQGAATTWEGREVMVLDTPGWFDAGLSQAEAEKKIGEIAARSDRGIDAFLLVRRYDRFDDCAVRTYNVFKNMFGEEAKKHAFWLFTSAGDTSVEDIRDETSDICELSIGDNVSCAQQDIFEDLGGFDRILAMGNLTPERRQQDREQVLQAVAGLSERNDGPYTHAVFKQIRSARATLRKDIDSLCEGHARDMLQKKFEGIARAEVSEKELADDFEKAREEERRFSKRFRECQRDGMVKGAAGAVLVGAVAAVAVVGTTSVVTSASVLAAA